MSNQGLTWFVHRGNIVFIKSFLIARWEIVYFLFTDTHVKKISSDLWGRYVSQSTNVFYLHLLFSEFIVSSMETSLVSSFSFNKDSTREGVGLSFQLLLEGNTQAQFGKKLSRVITFLAFSLNYRDNWVLICK